MLSEETGQRLGLGDASRGDEAGDLLGEERHVGIVPPPLDLGSEALTEAGEVAVRRVLLVRYDLYPAVPAEGCLPALGQVTQDAPLSTRHGEEPYEDALLLSIQ